MASDEENAEFRGELRVHMRTTAQAVTEIKEDARRQVTATDSLRAEVTAGFGAMDTRIALVEQAQSTHEAQAHIQTAECDTRFGKIESGGGINVKHTAVATGGGAATALFFRELFTFLKGVFP